MNLNNNPTIEQLRTLISIADDEAGHHCLWVDTAGDVHIDMIPQRLTPNGFESSQPTMAIRFETFGCGNGYVGATAAKDAAFVTETFNDLIRIWPLRKPGTVIYTDGSEY